MYFSARAVFGRQRRIATLELFHGQLGPEINALHFEVHLGDDVQVHRDRLALSLLVYLVAAELALFQFDRALPRPGIARGRHGGGPGRVETAGAVPTLGRKTKVHPQRQVFTTYLETTDAAMRVGQNLEIRCSGLLGQRRGRNQQGRRACENATQFVHGFSSTIYFDQGSGFERSALDITLLPAFRK